MNLKEFFLLEFDMASWHVIRSIFLWCFFAFLNSLKIFGDKIIGCGRKFRFFVLWVTDYKKILKFPLLKLEEIFIHLIIIPNLSSNKTSIRRFKQITLKTLKHYFICIFYKVQIICHHPYSYILHYLI